MLKLTEAELAEMGFQSWTGAYISEKALTDVSLLYYRKSGDWTVSSGQGTEGSIFPQTKEDLLTLIRLFTPPHEVKDVS